RYLSYTNWYLNFLNCMSKYTVKNKKKQDIMDKSTKKKRKNGVLAYFMEKLVSENLVSENTLELVKECNTFMMMVADETLEKKKKKKSKTKRTSPQKKNAKMVY